MKPLKAILCFLALCLTISCTKQGPAGTTGPQGSQGPQGNADVQSVDFPNQSFTSGIVLSLAVPAITQAILDSGSVAIYTRPVGFTDWVPLPFQDENETINAWSVYVGHASLVSNFNSSATSNYDFRVVVIAGQ